jgi:hypothetical protein
VAMMATVLAALGSSVTVAGAAPLEFDALDVAGWHMPTFTAVRLAGVPMLTGVEIPPFSVVDGTASGAGWHVDATITDLVHQRAGDVSVGAPGPDYTVPASSMSMTKPWVADQSNAGAPDATTRSNNADVTSYDVASFDTVSGNRIVSAAAQNDTGGTFLISPMPLRVLVPSDASAGLYTATVTLDLVSGP